MKQLRKIQPHLQSNIDTAIDSILNNTVYNKYRNGIKGYIADVRAGQAHYKDCVFTVPYWAYKPDYPKNLKTHGGYFIYYVAHELAHLLSFKKHGEKCNHDHRFYEIFREICPSQYQYFELGYKKSSGKYGISKNNS